MNRLRYKVCLISGLSSSSALIPYDYLVDTKYLFPERSSDEKNIKHHECKVPSGCKMFHGETLRRNAWCFQTKHLSILMDHGPSKLIDMEKKLIR